MANLPQLLTQDSVKKTFSGILQKGTNAFLQSVLSIYNSNEQLRKCEPISILSAAKMAAILNLPINPSFGYAYIVPFGNKATFQVGWRGYIQLALRSGKYSAIHTGPIFNGEIKGVDCITGELIRGEKISEDIVGYVAYFKLLNGFEKSLYMTKAEIEDHALKYSQTYQADKKRQWSTWAKYFDQMACKTVLKLLLTRFGILSSDMAEAIRADQAAISYNQIQYVDNDGEVIEREPIVDFEEVDIETGEIKRQGDLNEDNGAD